MVADKPLSYWMAVSRIGFEDDLVRLMEKKGVSRNKLASAIGVSPPFISKVLAGSSNYQLKTLVKLARGVGAVLEIRLADENGEVVRVLDTETASTLDHRENAGVRQLHSSDADTTSSSIIGFEEFKARQLKKAENGKGSTSFHYGTVSHG